MEHLSLPKNRWSETHVQIPYICKTPYDYEDFLNYPTRKDISFIVPPESIDRPVKPLERDPASREERESFLQSWLFFGLIHEILGQYI